MTFDEMRSDLDNCFSYIAINVSATNIQYCVVPTQSCKLQIVDDTMDNNSYAYAITVDLGGIEFNLDIGSFVQSY